MRAKLKIPETRLQSENMEKPLLKTKASLWQCSNRAITEIDSCVVPSVKIIFIERTTVKIDTP